MLICRNVKGYMIRERLGTPTLEFRNLVPWYGMQTHSSILPQTFVNFTESFFSHLIGLVSFLTIGASLLVSRCFSEMFIGVKRNV